MFYDGTRAAFIQVLRDLATYYEIHPDAPLPEQTLTYYVLPSGDEVRRLAEVDRIGALIGVCAGWRNGYYAASREFGPAVTYEVVAIPAAVPEKAA